MGSNPPVVIERGGGRGGSDLICAQGPRPTSYSFYKTRGARGAVSEARTSSAYGIGIMTVIVGVAAGVVFYQGFYLPESLEKPAVDPHILHPTGGPTAIDMIVGSTLRTQEDNFVPKLVNIQLGIDNLVVWNNLDDTAHTVTPSHAYADGYSGQFGSDGVVMPGESYEFLFTEPAEIDYYCTPHPWMTGTLSITKQRF